MKNILFQISLLFLTITCLGQNSELNTKNSNIVLINGRAFESTPEFNLNDSIQREQFLNKIETERNLNSNRFIPFSRYKVRFFYVTMEVLKNLKTRIILLL